MNQKKLLVILIILLSVMIIIPILNEYTDFMKSFLDRNFESIAIGVFSSIIASIIFVTYSNNYRMSNIQHTDKIFKTRKDDKTRFSFKIVNFSRRPIFDLNVVLRKQSYDGDRDSSPLLSYDIELLKGDIGVMAGYKRNDEHSKNAIIVHTLEDIEQLLSEEDSTVYFELTFRDGYSGLQRSIGKRFKGIESVLVGEYAKGNTFKPLKTIK